MKCARNTRSAPVILGLLACLTLTAYGDQTVQARFENSLEAAKAAGNIEIKFLDTLSMPNGFADVKGAFSRTIQYSYIASGSKYRARYELISATHTNVAKQFESAFDQKKFSSYDGGNRYMTQRTNSPPGDSARSGFNPLVAPFMFLTPHSDDCGTCALDFTDLVSLGNKFTLPSGQRSKGVFEISVAGLPIAKKPTFWKIVIDEFGDSFTPKMIGCVILAAKSEYLYKLLNYTNVGGYRFPTRIEWTATAYPRTTPPTLLETGLVTVISARIPDQIPDSTFRLDSDERAAAVIWDWDQHKLRKSAPELAGAHTLRKTVRIVFILFLLTTLSFTIVAVRRLSSRT